MNEILEHYDKNGFYIAKRLIDKEFIDLTVKCLKKYFDNQLSYLEHEVPNDI
jgi:hypothetical protein